jgi:hypothetical protein
MAPRKEGVRMEGGRARISLEFVRESEILDPRDATFFVRRTIVPRFSLPLAKVVPYRARWRRLLGRSKAIKENPRLP